MSTRPAWMLLGIVLALLVCISSIWLLPAGEGSFSAVHGPTSPLLAWRSAIRVISCIRAILVFDLLLVAPPILWATKWLQLFAPPPLSNTDLLTLACVLRS